jgi:hypothetical protein
LAALVTFAALTNLEPLLQERGISTQVAADRASSTPFAVRIARVAGSD